jgi:prephenate dehydrogenase
MYRLAGGLPGRRQDCHASIICVSERRSDLSNVVVVGAGAVGSLLCRQLASLSETVTVVDVRDLAENSSSPVTAWLRADIRVPTEQVRGALARADVVILAIPQAAALDGLAAVVKSMREGALLVDTLSVKSRIVGAILRLDPPLEVLSLNLMFAPALGFRSQSVLAVRVSTGPRSDAFEALLRAWGAEVVFHGAEDHDRITTTVQALTHAAILSFGDAVRTLGVDLGELICAAPPPHRTLLALLARILSGEPEVYWDIQDANPFAKDARQALASGVAKLGALVDAGDNERFTAWLIDQAELLGDLRGPLAEDCARIFATPRQPHREP